MSVREKYPLEKDEANTLVANLALTQALLLLGGVAGAMVVSGLSTGEWAEAILHFGWARAIGRSICALPLWPTLGAGLGLAALFLLLGGLSERQALKGAGGEASVIAARRGINGELPRLGLPLIVLLMFMSGCAEELLFRFALLGGCDVLFGLFMPAGLAALCALVLSSFLFWMAHVRYRDFWSSALTLALAVALGLAFLASGSVAVVAIAHFAYDLIDVLAERWKMVRDPDYFRGSAPARVLLDMVEARQGEGGDAKGAAGSGQDASTANEEPQDASQEAKAPAGDDDKD